MVGKASLIMILGFSLIFMVMGYFWGDLATRSVDNHVSYYKNTIAHNIAVSGINIALRYFLEDNTWISGFTRDFENGQMDVSVNTIIADTSLEVVSVGKFMGAEKEVRVNLLRSTFAKYAWFSRAVTTGGARPWYTGDKIFGAYHSNNFLNISGDPVFYGKVTTCKGWNDLLKSPYVSKPDFLGGFVSGVENVNLDTKINYEPMKTLAQSTGSFFDKTTVWLTFNNGGTVTVRTKTFGNDDSIATAYGAAQTYPLETFAPSGIIYVETANVYVSGVLDLHALPQQNLTIVHNNSSGTRKGVYITNDLVYKERPMNWNAELQMYEPNNDYKDVFTILTSNDVIFQTSNAGMGGYENNVVNKDVRIDGAIFSEGGGVFMEHINDPKYDFGKTGTFYLTGSMTTDMENYIANYSPGVNEIIEGYDRHIVLDERFLVKPPLWFPFSNGFEVISWFEE